MANNTVIHSVEFTGDASKLQAACQQAAQAVAGLGNATSANAGKVQSLTSSLDKLSSKVTSIGASLSLGLTTPLSLLGKQLFTNAASFEQIAVSFEVFTGSAEVAKNMLGQLKDMALRSPMQFQDIAKGTQTLLGYGLTAEQVIPITQRLGDISGGNSDKFSRLALAFGQVNAAGRLMGQETRQMINAGFNPLQAISDKTGESMASLSKRMHDGQISVQEVADAMKYATSEGGRFYGMLDKQSQTLQGQFNKLAESVTFAFAEIGLSLANNTGVKDFFESLGVIITKVKDAFLSLSPQAQNAILKLGLLLAVIGPLVLIVGGLIAVVAPLGALFAGISAVLAPFVGFLMSSTAGVIALAAAVPFLSVGVQALVDKITSLFSMSGKSKMPDTIAESIKSIEDELRVLEKRQELNIKINPTAIEQTSNRIIKLREELDLLKRNSGKSDVTFSNNAKGTGDEMSKAEKAKYDKLAEQARLGYSNINNQARLFSESKLEIFDRYAEEELNKLREFGLNTYRVEQTQYAQRQKLAQAETARLAAIVNKNSTIENLKKSLAKMVDSQVESVKRIMAPMDKSISENKVDLKDFVAGLDSTNIDLGFNEAKTRTQADNLKRFGAEVYAAQVQVATQLAVGFSEIIGSVMSGDLGLSDAFASIGALFLNAIGGFMVQVGQAAIQAGIIKLIIDDLLKGVSGAPLIGIGMAAVAIGTAMQNAGKKTSQAIQAKAGSSVSSTGMASSTASGVKSGNIYQSGSQTYGGQVVRLAIDLTGSITSTQTGYQINKSLETVLRVTGR